MELQFTNHYQNIHDIIIISIGTLEQTDINISGCIKVLDTAMLYPFTCEKSHLSQLIPQYKQIPYIVHSVDISSKYQKE